MLVHSYNALASRVVRTQAWDSDYESNFYDLNIGDSTMARREIERLNARLVATIEKPGRHADGGGLYLAIDRRGGRRWTFLYRERGTGRAVEMGLGPAAAPKRAGVSLADARRRAAAARALLFDGIDPLREKRARAAADGSETFGPFADALVDAIAPGFKSEIHVAQWRRTFEVDCASLRPLLLNKVTTDDVLRILAPIWETKHETATRVRGRIERVLDAATAKGLRHGDNPARWRGHLKELLAKRKGIKVHHAALPVDDVPAFMVELRGRSSVSARALEFTILTAARTGETLGARWSEIDFDAKIWTVPAVRMKAGREHAVPLSDRALAILKSMRPKGLEIPNDAFVFPGGKRGAPLSQMAMLELTRQLRPGYTVHGFRSSFRDWCGDRTVFPREIVEQALAHVIANRAEAAYRRQTAVERRRKLMAAWALFLAAPAGSNVLPMARPAT